ncbi:hypothetical protein ACLOJK_024481 [Asimina triloba]
MKRRPWAVGSSLRSKTNMPCAACKLLRRRCTKDCIFLPHFPSTEPEKFVVVHRIFGASNVSKTLQVMLAALVEVSLVASLAEQSNAITLCYLITYLGDHEFKTIDLWAIYMIHVVMVMVFFGPRLEIPANHRADAVSSMVYEANERLKDPIYGCVASIASLQTQVSQLQSELAMALADTMTLRAQLSEALSIIACTTAQKMESRHEEKDAHCLSAETGQSYSQEPTVDFSQLRGML